MGYFNFITVLSALVSCCLLQATLGDYFITTPLKWTIGAKTQVCMGSSNPTPQDKLRIMVISKTGNSTNVIYNGAIVVPVGNDGQSCDEITVPYTSENFVKLHLSGTLGDASIDETRTIYFGRPVRKTFIQTDKYLYKAGQKVQFRILTVDGPFFQISTETYPEVFVETPSGSRIAQWLNVSNPSGLLHLDMQLIEEPEEGEYKIIVKEGESGHPMTQIFKIEDYVLPRFEVTFTPPKYVYADANVLVMEVCARYNFAQPVKGTLTVDMHTNGQGEGTVQNKFSYEISGCKEVKIPLLSFFINAPGDFVSSMAITVEVEEAGTGNVISDSAEIPITRNVLTFKDDYESPTYKKPELPYTKTIAVTFPDGAPASGQPMSVCVYDACRTITTDDNGRLTYIIPPHLVSDRSPPEAKSINYPNRYIPHIYVTYMHRSKYTLVYANSSYSPSNSSLLLQPSQHRLSCPRGERILLELPVQYAAVNTTTAQVFVQVVSRGQIQYWKSVSVQFNNTGITVDEASLIAPILPPLSPHTRRGQFVLSLELPSTVSPNVHVIVWYTRSDREVVSDSKKFTIDKCLDHQVGLSWPNATVEQGSALPLTLTAQPDSICSLGIVDKSVELLSGAHHSLTLDTVFELAEHTELNSDELTQINDYNYCHWRRGRGKRSIQRDRYSSDFVDTIKMFDITGLHIITDLTIETRPCIDHKPAGTNRQRSRSGGRRRKSKKNSLLPVSKPVNDLIIPDHPGNSSTAPRQYFPETWLWELNIIGATGAHVQELILPDTITEWVGKAVCVHPSKGLGISRPTSITTYTPFFIDLTVLPNVKKGEIMPIKISVFNYLESSLPVRITLEASAEYDILDNSNFPETPAHQAAAGNISVCIPSNDKQTVTIRVRPQAVGQVNVTVTAIVDSEYPHQCGPEIVINKVDRIIRPITVEYEGLPNEKTWTKYMCSNDINETLHFFSEWHLEAPSNIVPESERAWVTVVGDLLGPTIENLGNLIQMPSGCGEQNMLNFAPIIFVQQYLEDSQQTTEAETEKIIQFLKLGYQQELNYKHPDGSYSAFGKSDDSGSTWLTAFVVKSFAQSQQYIDVDETELSRSREWLKNRQLKNGCFESVGRIIHKSMKGGLSEGGRPKVLAAFVLAALLEAGEDPAGNVVLNAIRCLGSHPDDKSSEPYELSLIAYALNLARLPEGEATLQKLMLLAVDTPAGLYWNLPNSNGRVQESSTTAVAVETAGYALMAMLAHSPDLYNEKPSRIVKWISAQRNSQGGFISTQDTVVALQSLALYEKTQNQKRVNLTVNVTGQGLAATFKVDESNKLLNQRTEVDVIPNDVMVDITGSGCALFQAVVRYNVKDPEPSEAFNMSVETSLEDGPNKCKKQSINVCVSYLLPDGDSNMAIIEVTLVSGFIPQKEDLERNVNDGADVIKRYEVNGNKVMFYVEKFTAIRTCVKFRIIKEVQVDNAKPGTVKVYDYYEPEFVISENYVLQICDDN